MSKTGMGMGLLGLSTAEEDIYRHFLRNPNTSADDIHLRIHSAKDTVHAALDRLHGLGLLRRTDAGDVTPADPETAVDRLTDLRLRELHHELQQVTQSRRLIAELRAEQGLRAPAPKGVERMEDLAQIRDRIDDLAFFAREEILSVEPYTALTQENIDHARPLDARCLRRGVTIRNVVLKEALGHPPTVAYLRELTAQGARIRVAPDISERILVYDRHTALVPADPDDTSRGALVAREAGLVANILALFEKIWDQATDLTALIEESAEGAAGLSAVEQSVLESMCRVGKDEIGARDLGISVRTYRRHVADLLRVLNASSRAHAALLARERGWI
ncbi:helix-turn-helix transcriptional regulator [Streptomyces roseoverticillatus]|uniref:helix-turn-helix transcriptional regulator n=1 Tax=Streptomyces roseoverticillatus TaxID=66429 RepID=UPI003F53E9FA